MKIFLKLIILILAFSLSAHAYKVFLHVGHDFTAKELLKSSKWKESAARADGVWSFDAWTRTLTKESDQNKVLKNVKKRDFYIAEFHWSPVHIGNKRKKTNEIIDAGERAKFKNIWCMVYDESRYGSTLSTNQIKRFRKSYPKYKLITNCRAFRPEMFSEELKLLDGLSYEFNPATYNKTSQHYPNQTTLENVIQTVKWAVDNNKKIFLLIPPGDKEPAKSNNFIKVFKTLLLELNSKLEKKYIKSDNLIIVPATYDCRKRNVHNTPEKVNGEYANTGMGATLIALDFRDELNSRELVLLPVPKQINFSSGVFKFKIHDLKSKIKKCLSFKIDKKVVPEKQGYQLEISPKQISIISHDKPGAYYASMTLRQIVRQCTEKEELPCVSIYDFPDIQNRAVMLDISRDKVPKMETLKNLINTLAEWKINQFQLYTEHTFAYKNHEVVWKDYSPMTAEQIRELDSYCKKRFIDLVPNQNSFGHFERWLKHPEYKKLAEVPEIPHSLNPENPDSIKLIEELYNDLLPNFSSKQFNVGCDETMQLGKGGSSNMVKKLGKGKVYLNFLKKIHKLVQQNGRTMMFWGDIVSKHPELICELPENVIALVWGYRLKAPYAERTKKYADAGVPFYVCPGTAAWNSLIGRTDNMKSNVYIAAKYGLENGTEGLMMTVWGDRGHWQHLPFEYSGIAYAAAMSWNFEGNQSINIPLALNKHLFMDVSNITGKVVYDLGETYLLPGIQVGFLPVVTRILYNPNFSLADEQWINSNSVKSLEKTLEKIDSLTAMLASSEMKCDDAELIKAEIKNGAALAKHAYKMTIIRLKTKSQTVTDIPKKYRKKLADELKKIIKEYKKIWLKRNRKGGLNDSVKSLNSLVDMYQK